MIPILCLRHDPPEAELKRTVVVPCLAVVLLSPSFAARAAPARAARADFSDAALAARVAVLRPALEAALGEPLGAAPRVECVGRGRMAALVLAERERFFGEWAAGADAGAELAAASRLVLGKTDLATGRILVQPAAFVRLQRLFPALDGLLGRDFLDQILVHEMVHLHQHRGHDLGRFVSGAGSFEAAQCRLAVLEGHAQAVTRRVARARGTEAAFDLLVRLNSGEAVRERSTSLLAEAATAYVGAAYVAGERLFAAVAARLGDEAATERLFARPPTRLPELLRPEEYLSPRSGPDLRGALAAAGRRIAGARGAPRAMPTTRALLAAAAGLPASAPGLADFLDGVWCAPAAEGAGWSLAAVEFGSVGGARAFLGVERAGLERGAAGGRRRFGGLRGSGEEGFTASAAGSETVVLRVGRIVVEVGAAGPGADAARVLAEAEALAAALR